MRLHFNRIFRMKSLHEALLQSETIDAALMNLLFINILVGCASNSKLMIPGLTIAAETLASNEQTVIRGLKNSLKALNSVPVNNATDFYKKDEGSLESMIASHEGQLNFIQKLMDSPFGKAGQLSNRGGAANNREGAARGALIRALDQCIPPGYSPKNGFNRYALIKQLLGIADIEASPALIRRLIYG